MKLKLKMLIGSLLLSTFARAEIPDTTQPKKGKVQLRDLMCIVRATPEGTKYQAAIAAEAVLDVKDLETNENGDRGTLSHLNILYSDLMNDCSVVEKLNYAAARRFGFVSSSTTISQKIHQSHRPDCTYSRIEVKVSLSSIGHFDLGVDQSPSIQFQGAGSVLQCKE